MFKIKRMLLLVVVIIVGVVLSGCYQTQSQQEESSRERERLELMYDFYVLFLEIADTTVDMATEEIVFNYIATDEAQEKISSLQSIADKMKMVDYELYRTNMSRRLGNLNNFLVFYRQFESDGNFENIYWLDGLNLEMSRPNSTGLDMIRENVEFLREELGR